MSYNYSGFVSALSNLAGTEATNPYFTIELPNAIDYAEQRLFRDLDLIVQVTTDASQVCAPGSRKVAIPSAFVVINNVNIITPAGSAPDNGTRNQLVPASEDYLDMSWPSSAGAGVPGYFNRQSQGNIIIGKWPDQNYTVEFVGTQRPAPLSATNPNTFLATNLPDIMLVGAMIHMCAYQKNWSSLGDDPQGSATYENQYDKLLASADAEELRKRYTGSIMLPPLGMAKTPVAPDAKG